VNFRELREREVRRIPILRTSVNKGKKRAEAARPRLSAVSHVWLHRLKHRPREWPKRVAVFHARARCTGPTFLSVLRKGVVVIEGTDAPFDRWANPVSAPRPLGSSASRRTVRWASRSWSSAIGCSPGATYERSPFLATCPAALSYVVLYRCGYSSQGSLGVLCGFGYTGFGSW
jgi:hypothetical protein